MSGLYVKLDAEYASDDRLIEAGPMPELLYIRGLCFCKRTMVDGIITARQLPAVALGIPKPATLAKALVESGAWVAITEPDKNDEHQVVAWRIAAWLKRNKSVEQIEAEREARRQASVAANHAQYHVGKGKKPSSKCELCRPDNGSDLADFEQ